jgi:hypothetical protein
VLKSKSVKVASPFPKMFDSSISRSLLARLAG